MMLKSQLGRKRSRAEIEADKRRAAEKEEASARNEARIAELEAQLGRLQGQQ